ncbi:alpha-ribazole phosphatase [Bradyrhizobium lablabi]|uniref:Alpha-ribazole phosphatase n=1 Tax=Bradyrhizobium lablabi TaxID=722472 RepID=A0A1M6SBS8_9BRAD|nr:histidine phosphatase family protein [Bradyrhizobium lablabi]SHK42224.1 alpha-ribazole phosphatase [Bradyrhizobium lablabi]
MLVDLLRHGATGREGHLDGRTDRVLAAEGWTQFSSQTEHQSWPTIVTSPLLRAREAAERLARSRNLALMIDDDWAELDFGVWDGRLKSELEAEPAMRAALAAFYRDPRANPPPGGESWASFDARIARALSRLVDPASPGPVLVVTHAGPMRAALHQACGLPIDCLWALRIGFGTRIRLNLAVADARLWGEIVEISQP